MAPSLHAVDYLVLAVFFLSTVYIGWRTMRKAGKDSSEFFLSGRSTPWWLLGFSLVATTFSADTPNLVTDIVRQNGGSRQLGLVGVSSRRFNDRFYLCQIMA